MINYDELIFNDTVYIGKTIDAEFGDLMIEFFNTDINNITTFFDKIRINTILEPNEEWEHHIFSYTFYYSELLQYIGDIPDICKYVSEFDDRFKKMYMNHLRLLKIDKIRGRIFD